MASIVQAGIPVSQNVPMQMAQIANALQSMRARHAMEELEQERLEAQRATLPFKQAVARQQLDLAQQRLAQQREHQAYMEAHPYTGLTGLAQQVAYMRGLAQEGGVSPSSPAMTSPSSRNGAQDLSPLGPGAPEEGSLGKGITPDLNNAADAYKYMQNQLLQRNQYQQQRGNYYEALTKTLQSGRRDIPASLVPSVYATAPLDSAVWANISPIDRANVQADAKGMVARKLTTPTILNQIQYLGTASDLLDKSNQDLAYILNKSSLQGYPKLMELNVSKALEKVGRDSPEYNHLKSFEMQQKLLSAEIRRLINAPNVSEESKDMLRTIDVDWRNMSINNIIRQREVLANFLESQRRRLRSTVSPARIQSPMIPVNIPHLGRKLSGKIGEGVEKVRVKAKDGTYFTIPKDQLEEARASGLLSETK